MRKPIMQKMADIALNEKVLFVSGDMHFSNVTSLYDKSLKFITQCPELIFDFSRLTSSDSAGVALILEWIKLAKKKQKTIQFQHLTPEILSIAGAAGLDGLMVRE